MSMSDIQPVVSPEWLSTQLNNPQVIIVDCRFRLGNPAWGYQQYLNSHIPGAYYLDLDKDLSAPLAKHGGRHPLPDPALLAQKLAAIGMAPEALVVACDDSRFAFAARLWWLLRYLGHDRAAILDGGFPGWLSRGYPITDTIPTPKPGHFLPQPRRDSIVDIEAVKALKDLPSVVLVDSREGDRYQGEREPIDPIAGHIPAAVNSPWIEVSDPEGYLRPQADQEKLWQNYQQADEIIVYCGSGVTACVNLLSLELAGITQAKLYPGGWSDWCSYLA